MSHRRHHTLRASDTAKTLTLSAPLEITAAAGAGDAAGTPPSFQMIAYSGGLLRGAVKGVTLPVVIDLAGAEMHPNIVADLDHERHGLVGHVTAANNDGKQLKFNGLISAATPEARQVIESHKNGFRWEASIMARLSEADFQLVGRGRSVTVNGQQFSGPLIVARKSFVYRVAFTPQGADAGNLVSIAASVAPSGTPSLESSMEPDFVAWLVAHNWNPEALPEDKVVQLKASWQADKDGINTLAATLKPQHGSIADVVAAQEAENTRVEGITHLLATWAESNPGQIKTLSAMAQAAIDNKLGVEACELQIRRECEGSRPRISDFKPRATSQVSSRILEAAVCQAGGLAKPEKHYTDQELQTAHDRFKSRGIGLNQLYQICARANGYRDDFSGEVTAEVQNFACGYVGPELRAAGGMSTIAIPGILSNTANKFLEEGWLGQDMAWREITKIRPVKNFLTHTSYKLSGNFKYLKVGPTGELHHGAISESTYTDKADTYGIFFGVGRTELINDDLGAITEVPREMGMGANDGFNEVFWSVALDNSAFFASGNLNVSTGAGSALALAGLNAADVVFMNQTKPNGSPLAQMPAILLVPTTLKNTAFTLVNAEKIIDGTSTAAQGDVNPYRGRFRIVSSPYMENALFTGYSTAAWYLLADPARLAFISTAFLNGREAPTVETSEAPFNVLGIVLRAFHDWGCNLREPRAGVRSAGS